MDLGEYDTNTLLINNISSVSFRVYEPAWLSSAYTFAASDVEKALRSDGHLVYADSVRRGIWCFYLIGREGSSVSQSPPASLGPSLDVCGYKLSLVDEGFFDPISLLRSRPPGTNSINTPNSSSSAGSAVDSAGRGPQAFNNALAAHAFTGPGAALEYPMKLESKGYSSVPVREMYDYFISATLASLSAAFCAKVGAIALNARSLVLPHAAVPASETGMGPSHRAAVLATFRVYLTTAGSLVIGLGLSVATGLMSSAEGIATNPLPSRIPVLVAPFGTFGTLQGGVDPVFGLMDQGFVQSPGTQIMRFRPDGDDRFARLRNDCIKILEMRGVPASVLSGSSWVSIQCPRRRADGKRTPAGNVGSGIIFWPAVLCFQKPTRLDRQGPMPFGQQGLGRAPMLDPLADAKTWLLSADERDALLLRRQKERDAAAAKEAADAAAGRTLHSDGYSPMGLRRPSHSNGAPVAGAMYPTPPDGIQNPATATPYLEGAVSSPSNAPPVPAPTAHDPDAAMAQHANTSDAFADGWDGADVKRADQEFLGDMGADIFGDNAAITDADFSFFDQPGDGDMDFSASPDVATMGIDTDHQADTTAALSFDGFSQKQAEEPSAPPPQNAVQPVFAKPELKHARSSLGDDTRNSSLHDRASRLASGVKRQPSPFNRESVFKRVKASIDTPAKTLNGARNGVQKPTRRGSVFEKVDFDPFLALNNKKYQENGRFECRWDSKKENMALELVNLRSPTVDISSPTLNLEPPTTPYLRRQVIKTRKKEEPANIGALIFKPQNGPLNLQTQNLPQRSPARVTVGGRAADNAAADDGNSSLESDLDDSSEASFDPGSPTSRSAVTRRRPDDDAISLATSLREFENLGALSPQVSVDLSRIANSDPPEVPLSRYFAELEPAEYHASLSDDDFVMVAQILTEQAALGLLKLTPPPPESDFVGPRETRRNLALCARHSVQVLQSVLPSSLAAAADCQFKPLLDVQDVPLPGQPSRAQPRPAAPGAATGAGAPAVGVDQPRPSLYPIPAPHLELRRHDSRLSLLPSAVDFWESLGLGPSQGAKDALSVCVFPDWAGMEDHADNFLNRMRNVYESLKLGSFNRLPSTSSVVDGIVSYEFDSSASTAAAAAATMGESPPAEIPASRSGASLNSRMVDVGQALFSASSKNSAKNFVAYFVYSPANPASIIDCCAAFQRLFETFQRLLRSEKRSGGPSSPATARNELVLQLVPLDALAELSSLAIPPPGEYVRLCLETYDRCRLFDSDHGLNSSSSGNEGAPTPAPAIVLDQPPPRVIDFKLTNELSTSVMHENSCMHLAYAQSVDERWVSAAWTDNRGIKQMTASYCLGRRSGYSASPGARGGGAVSGGIGNGAGNGAGNNMGPPVLTTPFSCVAREMWETTEELISAWQVHWHIVVTKCGAMDAHEAELWTSLQQTSTRRSVSLTLLTVDTDPSLLLVPPPVRVPASAISAFYTTPVSTPQAISVMSPDGGPSTPMGGGGAAIPTTPGGAADRDGTAQEAEADAVLVDVTDITWGAVLSHRLSCGPPSPSPSPSSSSPSPLADASAGNPSLASGYLVKRGGGCAEDPPVVLEVCVVHADVGPRMYEAVLREMLACFRGLGTLARVRGAVDRETDVRPWHVAAAEKGVQAVYQLM